MNDIPLQLGKLLSARIREIDGSHDLEVAPPTWAVSQSWPETASEALSSFLFRLQDELIYSIQTAQPLPNIQISRSGKSTISPQLNGILMPLVERPMGVSNELQDTWNRLLNWGCKQGLAFHWIQRPPYYWLSVVPMSYPGSSFDWLSDTSGKVHAPAGGGRLRTGPLRMGSLRITRKTKFYWEGSIAEMEKIADRGETNLAPWLDAAQLAAMVGCSREGGFGFIAYLFPDDNLGPA